MTTSAELLEQIAPEFAADPRADLFLTLAASRLHVRTFGNLYVQAVVYLAAHMLTMSPDDDGDEAASAGPVTGRGTGDLSVNYATARPPTNDVDAELGQTRYGRAFLAIRNTRAYVAPFVVC